MLAVITKAGRLVIAAVFAMALTFGATQLIASSGSAPCDTPPGVCSNNDDCDDACADEGHFMGGWCAFPEDCCVCIM